MSQLPQLVGQTYFIHALQHPGAQGRMHFHRGGDYFMADVERGDSSLHCATTFVPFVTFVFQDPGLTR